MSTVKTETISTKVPARLDRLPWSQWHWMIVLATRGSMSMLLGTVSQYVLRKAPCPVLVVPAGASAS